MSELMQTGSAFGRLVQDIRERSRHIDLLYTNILIDLATADVDESDLEHGDVYIDVDDTNSPPILQRFDEDTVSDNDDDRDSQSNDPPVLHRFDTFDYELIEIVSASSSDFIINEPCADFIINEPRADFIINEPWARQDMANDAYENDELMSMSSHDSDSGFGESDSIISSISEFSSTTAELRYNEERHFGYIVAPEHVSPHIIVNESWRHARSLAVSDWVEEIDKFVYACAYVHADADGFSFGHTSEENDDVPVRECSSDTHIQRDRKRKRDAPNDVMKCSSVIDCSYKKGNVSYFKIYNDNKNGKL